MTQVRLYETTPVLPTASAGDSSAVSVGLQFSVSVAATLVAIYWWQATTGADTGARTIGLYSTTDGLVGTLVGTTKTQAVSGTGWQTITLDTPITLDVGVTYMATVYHPGGQYVAIGNYYTSGGPGYGTGPGVTTDIITVPNSTFALNSIQNGFNYGGAIAFPDQAFNGGMYGIDVLVQYTPSGGTPVPDMNVYDGSAWQSGFLYAYDGTQWLSGEPGP